MATLLSAARFRGRWRSYGIRMRICSVRMRKRPFFGHLPEVEGLISGSVQAMDRLSHLDLGCLDSRLQFRPGHSRWMQREKPAMIRLTD